MPDLERVSEPLRDDSAPIATTPPLPADLRRVIVPFLEPLAAVDIIVERAAGDGAVDVLDQAAALARLEGQIAIGRFVLRGLDELPVVIS